MRCVGFYFCVFALCFFGCSCGVSFEAVASSPESPPTLLAEGSGSDSGELEASSKESAVAESPGKGDASPPADSFEAASLVSCDAKEWQRECLLWWHRELPRPAPCAGRCGGCDVPEGQPTICIEKE